MRGDYCNAFVPTMREAKMAVFLCCCCKSVIFVQDTVPFLHETGWKKYDQYQSWDAPVGHHQSEGDNHKQHKDCPKICTFEFVGDGMGAMGRYARRKGATQVFPQRISEITSPSPLLAYGSFCPIRHIRVYKDSTT